MRKTIYLKSEIRYLHASLDGPTMNPKLSLAGIRRRNSDKVFRKFRLELDNSPIVVGRDLTVLAHKRTNLAVLVKYNNPEYDDILLAFESVDVIEEAPDADTESEPPSTTDL